MLETIMAQSQIDENDVFILWDDNVRHDPN
jgi:hypothetical protein